MALVLKDRVKETTTTAGTGTVTLAGAVTGYQSFSAIGNGNTTYYCIAGQSGSEWEVGIGTYTSSGTTLSRDTVLASSNAGSLVTFSAGTKDVFVTYPASEATPNSVYGYTTTATAAGTTTLTATSTYLQYFTGSTTQTVQMPVTSTLSLGWSFHICNNSTGNLTVNSSGGNLIGTVLPGTTAHITCVDITVTTAAGWDFGYTDFGSATGTGSVVLSDKPSIVSASAITAGTQNTYALTVGNSSSSDFTIGSDGTYVYLQSWGGRTLRLNDQGNPIEPRTNVKIYSQNALSGAVPTSYALGLSNNNTGSADFTVGSDSSFVYVETWNAKPLRFGALNSGTAQFAQNVTFDKASRVFAGLMGFTSTATAASTTTLTDTSTYYQLFTGTSTQTVQLPDTSTLQQGWSFHIVNNSTQSITVQTSTAVTLGTVPPTTTGMPTVISTAGNTAGDWEFGLTDFSSFTGTGSLVLNADPTINRVQVLDSTPITVGTAGTYAAVFGNDSNTDFGIGSDASVVYLQTFNAKTLNLQQANNSLQIDCNTGVKTAPQGGGYFTFVAGTATTAPLLFNAGTTLTTPAQGSFEFDGAQAFITANTSTGEGRQLLYPLQVFELATSATVASGGAFFTNTKRPAMIANRRYIIDIYAIFQKSTAGTVTFSFSNSAAVNFTYLQAIANTFVQGAVSAALTNSASIAATGAATTTSAASASLANNANCFTHIRGVVQPSANTRLQLNVTCSAGTVTSLLGSTFILAALSDVATVGNFA